MTKAEKTGIRMEVLSLATLSSAVVLVLGVGLLSWALGTFAWPGAEYGLQKLMTDDGLLTNALIVAAILIGKEIFMGSKPLTIAVNSLAAVVSLGYLALYLSVSVRVLLAYSPSVAILG